MSRNLTPKGKIVRRLGVNIYGNPKFDRLLSEKPYPPGQHGSDRRRRETEYGRHLLEKQKVMFCYGLSEKQLRNYFAKAKAQKGQTGHNLLILMERRLDNVIYRLKFATTRTQARQFVLHGHVRVNGRKVNIASYIVKAGDVITVRDKESSKKLIERYMAEAVNREVPAWISFAEAEMTGKIERMPERAEIDTATDEQLIVEHYSK